MNRTKGVVRVFACGGAGINIVSQMQSLVENSANVDYSAQLQLTYLDTSLSNLASCQALNMAKNHGTIEYMVLDDMDGSGKVRAENYDEISNHVRLILEKFRPGNLNIVVSSGSGGSGSVLAPVLTSALIKQNKLVIPMTIGSTDSILDAKNTVNTLKSYVGISRATGRPVTGFYLENGRDGKRAAIDDVIRNYIKYLTVLFSNQNHGMDSRDLRNWLNYDLVTGFEPDFSSLVILTPSHAQDVEALSNKQISIASLTTDNEGVQFAKQPEYACCGTLDVGDESTLDLPTHFVIVDGDIHEAIKALNKVIDDGTTATASRPRRQNILGDSTAVDDSGVVL